MNNNAKICWLSGSFFNRKKILEKIKESIINPDIYVFDEHSAEEISDQILGNTLFSNNRIVILKDIPNFSANSTKSNEKWINIFDNIPDDCIVVVNGVESKSKQKIYAHIQKIGKIFDFPQYLEYRDATSYCREEFEKLGKLVEDSDLEYIVNNIGLEYGKGYDIDKIISETLKIVSYIGNRKKNIEHVDIEKCVTKNSNFIIWEMLDIIETKNYYKCQKILKNSCEVLGIREAINSIIPMLNRKFRLLLMIKEQLIKGINKKEIINNIKKIHKFKEENNIFSPEKDKDEMEKFIFSDYEINKAINTSDKYNRTEIFKSSEILKDCYLKLRYIYEEEELLILIDNFLLYICGIENDNNLKNLRRFVYGR